jgi:hypothetical protein
MKGLALGVDGIVESSFLFLRFIDSSESSRLVRLFMSQNILA